MSIKKSRSKDISNLYLIRGREHIVFFVTLPSGEQVHLSFGFGAKDVNGCEYFYCDAMFDPTSKVEFSQDIPQNAKMLVRLPATKGDLGQAKNATPEIEVAS